MYTKVLWHFPAFYVWQWEDEKGNYNSYSAAAALDLEEAQSAKESTYDLEACHRSYTIDLGKMEQTNTVTDVTRKVAREESSEWSEKQKKIIQLIGLWYLFI